jgi:hypothetical protein
MAREPAAPWVWITAPKAAIATHISEGWVAIHASLVPSTALLRLKPLIAEQPDPVPVYYRGKPVS